MDNLSIEMSKLKSALLALLTAWAITSTYFAVSHYLSYTSAVNQLRSIEAELAGANRTVVAVLIDYGNGTTRFAKATVQPGSSVLNATLAVASVDYSVGGYGAFVESIDGVSNDPAANKWWLYYINGQLGTVAADKQVVETGDLVVWCYTKPPW